MSITGVRIKDFLVFRGELTANFGDGKGINIFVGDNGAGKTTLIKVLYAACSNKRILIDYFETDYKASRAISKWNFKDITTIDEIGMQNFPIVVHFSSGEVFTWGSPYFVESPGKIMQSVYIPEKDMLSNAKGLPKAVRQSDAQFNRTEIDIKEKASMRARTDKQLIYSKICNIIGGKPNIKGEKFYVERHDIGENIPFSMEASGFRKFALLAMLVQNEQIRPGSALFWDEPENSLNRELMPQLVNILLELANNGVQIFIATHEYKLVRYFDVRKNKDIPVLYHNLTKQAGNGQISCKSYTRYAEMRNNLLERANENLFEAVVADAMGDDDDE